MSKDTKDMMMSQFLKFAIMVLLTGCWFLYFKNNTSGLSSFFLFLIVGTTDIVFTLWILANLLPETFHFIKWLLLYPLKRQPYITTVHQNKLEWQKMEREETARKARIREENIIKAQKNIELAKTLTSEDAYKLGVKNGYDNGYQKGNTDGYQSGYYQGNSSATGYWRTKK